MLEKLREADWGKKIKVIVLTNINESEIAENIKDLNVSGLIVKAQLTPAQVVEKTRSVLNS